jgi:peptidoglycan/LPS O-acetylase OafA/YrhL
MHLILFQRQYFCRQIKLLFSIFKISKRIAVQILKFTNRISLFADIKEIPATLDQKIYPSLNGLRAISIIMVVIHHYILNYNQYFHQLIFIGPLGVDVFFVISGFLITTLCIKEKIATGTLSLKNFYIRRALRILPVAYLYIIVILILNYVFKLQVGFLSFLSSALFIANVSYFRRVQFDWNLAHYWSLSVEEQFYILFPVFIKKKFQLYVAIVLMIVLLAPIIIYLQTFIPFLNAGAIASALRYVIKFQGIAVGCLFSILLFKGYLNFGKFSLITSLVSIFMIFYMKFDPLFSLQSCFTNLVTSVFVGLIIVNNISPKNNLLFRFLNLKVLNIIGILSYSIYIWQELFLSNDTRFPLAKYPVNLVFLVVIPCLSYFYYEKYFLKLKAKFIKTKTA